MNFMFILLVPITVIGANDIGPCDICQAVAHLLQYPKGGAFCKSTGACKEAVLSEKCPLFDKMVANGLANVLEHRTNPDTSKSNPGKAILYSVRSRLLTEHQKCHQIDARNVISKDPTTLQCVECTLLVEVTHFVFETILGGPVEDALKQTLHGVCAALPPPFPSNCVKVFDYYTNSIFAGFRDSLTYLYNAVSMVLSPDGSPCPSPECVEAVCYSNQISEGCPTWG